MNGHFELLNDLSVDELEALAESKLAPAAQTRMSDLLARNTEGQLTADEQVELDQILKRIDQLNILKARALLTLQSLKVGATGT
jgi:hypothetical protein